MPRLTDYRRDYINSKDWYIPWLIYSYMSKGLLFAATIRLGSEDDIKQFLTCEFCRIIAAMSDDPKDEGKVPPFISDQLVSSLITEINRQRNNLPRTRIDCYELGMDVMMCESLLYGVHNDKETTVDAEYAKVLVLIGQASEPTKSMIHMWLVEGRTQQEIASKYDITTSAVSSRIRLWLKVMREALRPTSEPSTKKKRGKHKPKKWKGL